MRQNNITILIIKTSIECLKSNHLLWVTKKNKLYDKISLLKIAHELKNLKVKKYSKQINIKLCILNNGIYNKVMENGPSKGKAVYHLKLYLSKQLKLLVGYCPGK